MSSISKLESLPDELLLELCHYLLCVDVLLAFDHLNIRLTRLIRDYYRHVSLHKASFAQFGQLCTDILPRIGTHIQSFVIDNCYSNLQASIFPLYFENRMSSCFPDLKRIILVSFRPDPLLTFLKILTELERLQTIDIRTLFRVPISQQTTVLLALLQANNHRLTSVLIDDQSSHLNPIKKHLPHGTLCSNIIRLKIELLSMSDLAVLFTIIPNVQWLSVSIHKNANGDDRHRTFDSDVLPYLTYFQLKSVEHSWYSAELRSLLEKLPAVEHLALNLRTSDPMLANGESLGALLPSQPKAFHYAIHYLPEQDIKYAEVVDTWKRVCPIICLHNLEQNDYMFLHTLPYSSFDYLEISASVARSTFEHSNSFAKVQRVHVDCELTLTEAFPILNCCPRARHTVIWLHGRPGNHENHPQSGNCLSSAAALRHMLSMLLAVDGQTRTLMPMPYLRRLTLVGLLPRDLHQMSTILLAAANLFRLDVNYNTLLMLLTNDRLCSLLQRRITALTINQMQSSPRYAQDNIARIAQVFQQLQHLYIDMRSLDATMDVMVLYYFDEFHKQNAPLIALAADGKPSNEMKTDAKKWLVEQREHLQQGQFAARFNEKAGRLMIWL